MALTTAELLDQASCINSCIPDGSKLAVLIYLLAVAARVDPTDTNALINNARCIDSCIPDGAKLSVVINLLNGLQGALTCGALSGEGDPTDSQNPSFIGQLYSDTLNGVFYYSTGLTSADWTLIVGA